MTGRPSRILCGALVLVGCTATAADHEALGDRAYVAGGYPDALTEYRLAVLQQGAPNARLRAKAAAAALRVGDLEGAVRDYLALAAADEDRADEAADGIERVARAAVEAGDRPALRAAVAALRELSEHRPPAGFTVQAARDVADGGSPAEALVVLPAGAAAAPDARLQDSLMYVYGLALARAGRCEPAAAVFEALARRQRQASVVAGASQGAASCALRLGRSAADAGNLPRAEEWFRRAVSQAGESALGRAAYLGLGDVMLSGGDLMGAVAAYQHVLSSATPGDSLAELARERLNRIANAGTVFP